MLRERDRLEVGVSERSDQAALAAWPRPLWRLRERMPSSNLLHHALYPDV